MKTTVFLAVELCSIARSFRKCFDCAVGIIISANEDNITTAVIKTFVEKPSNGTQLDFVSQLNN